MLTSYETQVPVFKFCRVRVLTTQSSFSITQELA